MDAEPRPTLEAGASDLPAAVAEAFSDPPPGSERVIEATGYAWHLVEWGDPADPPLLLVHGVNSSSETFWRIGPGLAAAHRRVVAVDLPGHGRTGGWLGRHRFVETAADLGGFIRAGELGRGDLSVVGHSWGAMIVAALPAAGFRPGRLVLLDPPSLSMAGLAALTQDPLERRYDHVTDAIEAIRASDVRWSEGDIRAKAIALTQVDETAAHAILLENRDFDSGLAALSHPAARDIPTWIIRGEHAHGGLNPRRSDSGIGSASRLRPRHHDRRWLARTAAHPTRGDDPGDPARAHRTRCWAAMSPTSSRRAAAVAASLRDGHLDTHCVDIESKRRQ